MNVSLSRTMVVTLAVIAEVWSLVVAAFAIEAAEDPIPYVGAMVLFVIAVALALWPSRRGRMPAWVAAFAAASAFSISLLVTSQLNPERDDPSAAWHVMAIAILMVVTVARGRQVFAWIGAGAMAVEMVLWHGIAALVSFGVLGALTWVAVAHVLSYSLAFAGRDARQYVLAEREAAEWRAAQEAHIFERQFRLAQTSRMALPILSEIVASGAHLTPDRKLECLHLEDAIRDEIRGRKLLNEAVRREVMAARRRGTIVTLLDEGGIDDLSEDDLDRVLGRLAQAIHDTGADRIVARTVPNRSDTAVTVVGVSTGIPRPGAQPLDEDSDDHDDELDLWLEIPRHEVSLSSTD